MALWALLALWPMTNLVEEHRRRCCLSGIWPYLLLARNISRDVVYWASGPVGLFGHLAVLALGLLLNCAGYQRLAACSRAACSLQLMVCSLPLVARSLPFAACSLQRAACGLQLEACSLHLVAIPQTPFLRTRSRLGPGTNRSKCAPMGPNGPMTPHID